VTEGRERKLASWRHRHLYPALVVTGPDGGRRARCLGCGMPGPPRTGLKRFASLVLAVVFVVSLVLGGRALAQEAESAVVQLTPMRDSGVSGTATLTDVEGGVKVELNMKGLSEADVRHINHFHGGGTCAEASVGRVAPVTIPLNTLVAQEDGTGSATTTLKDLTLDELLEGGQERFILVHAKSKEGQGIPPGISCGDLALPASGGSRPTVLLASGAAVVLGAAAGSLALLRRMLRRFA
jgi:Cu/Zn superoxide dismutase